MRIFTVDGGGSRFAYASLEDGIITHLGSFGSPESPGAMHGHIMDMAPEGLSCYDGIGIALAGVISGHATAVRCPHLQWANGIDLADFAMKRFELPCRVVNDMEAAAIGEMREGELREVSCGIADSIGTGWGGCTVLRIAGIEAVIPGEPGHMVNFGLRGPACGCGKSGCNDARYGGRAVGERVKKMFGDAIPRDMDPCAFLNVAAGKGEPWALRIYREVGQGIGIGWVNTLNRNGWIEKIVYMGTFAIEGMVHMQSHIRRTIRTGAMFPHHAAVPIVPSSVWPDGAHIGAAVIVESYIKCRDMPPAGYLRIWRR